MQNYLVGQMSTAPLLVVGSGANQAGGGGPAWQISRGWLRAGKIAAPLTNVNVGISLGRRREREVWQFAVTRDPVVVCC